MKKVLLVLVVVLVLVVAGLYAFGSSRPVEHVGSVRATFAAPAEEVWSVVTDFASYPEWNSMFRAVSRTDDVGGRPCWIYEGEWGPMPTIIDELTATHMVTRIAPEADIGFEGTWSYDVAPAPGGGCTVTLREDGRVPSPFFRAMIGVVFDMHDGMIDFLRNLGRHFDEEVEPEVVPLAG